MAFHQVTEHPEIDQECPSCGHNRLQFWTRQLRSADEGLSVFFLCWGTQLRVCMFSSGSCEPCFYLFLKS
ncbi:DNA-directed RNA polymerase I subunit RPA12 (DNA-directed RNA polymerase I subunit H) (Zinc ribbon domain-containing protein 1) [Durusdinium trenchii]|uniref:DNA-directed RNA polymerase I subunit RPA12 (DNA-directed RNA polymerase I subunit H) (Zinc ribbon domain-containing protein 1) n=1 Tax=Durusdinium trenchii TaxID=1381693 RepID=A0ABP0LDD3_9DINO